MPDQGEVLRNQADLPAFRMWITEHPEPHPQLCPDPALAEARCPTVACSLRCCSDCRVGLDRRRDAIVRSAVELNRAGRVKLVAKKLIGAADYCISESGRA